MKRKISETIQIPEGITCSYSDGIFKCSKDSTELSRKISVPKIKLKVHDNLLTFECEKGNKNTIKLIRTNLAHINNLFNGLHGKFTYELEAVNVHFPITLKKEGSQIAIGNFLGEKTPRYAKILPNVEVEIRGQKIIVSSANRESAGQTAANLEKATKVRGRDRRIFQDGIYLIEKPRRNI